MPTEISQDGWTDSPFQFFISLMSLNPTRNALTRHTHKSFYSWMALRAEEALYLSITRYDFPSTHHTSLCRVGRASIYGISLHLQHCN